MTDSISSQTNLSLPIVAIVGRPNVGKSTLFNRLVGRRHAITDPTPGVTRDVVEARCHIGNREVLLVDTGGFQLNADDLSTLVSQRSLDTIERADVVLLVFDVQEMTSEDLEFVETIRPYAGKLIAIINKVDNEQRERQGFEHHELGITTLIPISAEHRRNFDQLESAIYARLPEKNRNIEHVLEGAIHLTILGKPNTGKSTLLNTLLGYERAIVSPRPGTTRDVLEGVFQHDGKRFRILDTAGIRRKRSVKDAIEYYSVNRAFSSIGDSDIVLLVLDSIDGITDQDKKIASQAVKRGRAIILVFNKWDLVPDIPNAENAVRDRARFLFPALDFAPFVAISALTDQGIDKLLSTAINISKQLGTRIATPKLNQRLRFWVESHPPHHRGNKRFMVRYITQVSEKPMRFALFVNRKKGFPGSWVSYLKNSIRREFQLAGIPILIEVREG